MILMITVDIRETPMPYTDYMVRLSVTDELFCAYDHHVKAQVFVDYRLPDIKGECSYSTDLYRMLSPCQEPIAFKRTAWYSERGNPLPNGSEILAMLDQELRSFLSDKFNAQLYEIDIINSLPEVRVVYPWWKSIRDMIWRKK